MTDYRELMLKMGLALSKFAVDGEPLDTAVDIVFQTKDTGLTTKDGTKIVQLVVDTEMGPIVLGTVGILDSLDARIDPTKEPLGTYFADNDGNTALTAALVAFPFGFSARHFSLFNDELPAGASIFYEIAGSGIEVELRPGEGDVQDDVLYTQIKIKGAAGGEKYTLQAWS